MDVAAAAGFVGGILQVVFDKYYGSKLEQWAARSGLQDDACNLKTQLRMARAVLEIVGRGKPVLNDALSDLIKELKLAAYGADDALDEMDYYRLKELVESTRGSGGTNNPVGASSSAVQMVVRRSCYVLSKSNPFKRARTSIDSVVQGQEAVQPDFDRDAMSARIRSISGHLEKTADKVQKIVKLEKLVSMAAHPQPEEVNLRQTSSFLTEPNVFGRDEEINSIINMVLSKHLESRYKNVSVLPIVGIGGVGKTTLAQAVYNHPKVVSSFGVRAWACVSDTRDVAKVTADIVDSINGGKSHEIGRLPSLDAIQKTLMKKIEGKRFFIVLDDVWVNNWDRLCAPFSSGESGSMVVVTTRDQKIAEVMGSFDSVTLHGLQDDEFWSFFKQCANITEENNLAHIGRKIAKKLHGIPLAAKTMGRLLSRSHNEERWRSFLNNSNMWEVRQYPDDIMPVLRLSFQHLRPNLQCCFAYCAVFPKDCKISEQELIFGWMAQGFIPKPGEDEILEDTAKEYINELLWGCFFEKVDGSYYMMHDLLHDLARLVSEGECWVTNDKPIPAEVCHLFVSGPIHALDMGLSGPWRGRLSDRRSLSRRLLHLGRLKTLIFTMFTEVPIAVRNDWPTSIRSLCLSMITRKEQLVAVTNLKHLRYLDISLSDLEELPEEICKLYHLQVLNILACRRLRQLPPSMSNLVNLRHLLADEGRNFLASIPNVGNLTSLHELDMFCIGKTRDFDIAQLKDLRNLTRLKIGNLENVGNSGETSEARLNSKSRLTELSFSWSTDSYRQMSPSAEDVLEGLQPHPNIVSLHVEGYTGITSSTWLADKLTLTSLESLYLEDFSGLDFLPPLGQLPHLRKLHVTKMGAITIIGLGFYGDGQVKGFPRLEEMLISNMPEWTEWVGVEHICFFPALRSLIIQHCPKLNGLQVLCFSEKQWFPQLTRLEIEGCPEVVSFPCLKHSPSALTIQENGSILMKLDHQELCITGYKVFSSNFTVWSASKLYCTHLVSLYLEDCLEVEVLPPLGSLPQLRELHMTRMGALRQLGSEFYGSGRIMGFPCLKLLSIEDLPEWRDWNEGGHFDLFPHLESLTIDNCPELNRVPCILAHRENLRWFPSLNSLEIHCCPKVITFDLLFPQLPQFVDVKFVGQSYWISLGNNRFEINERGFTKSIPNTDHWINSKLASAEQVIISGSSVTDELLSDFFACRICPSLLSISGCERISTLDLSHLESLESLDIDTCDSIRHLSGLQAFIALKYLRVNSVPGFLEAWNSLLESGQTQQENFSTSLEYLEIDTASFLTSSFCSSLTSLKKLQLMDDDIKSFSEQQEQALTLLTSLESFTISGGSGKLLALPGTLHEVSTLKRLKVNNCRSIKFVGACFHKFAALEVLSVRGVPNFAEAWKMQAEAEGMHMEQINASLQVLEIDDFKILNLPVCKLLTNLQKLSLMDDKVAHISEEQGQALLLLSLQELEFTRCYELKALPNVLHRMLTLKHLKITYCHTTNSLPDDGLPASLERLTIRACRNLYDNCLEHGTERHKITHISEIVLERYPPLFSDS